MKSKMNTTLNNKLRKKMETKKELKEEKIKNNETTIYNFYDMGSVCL